MYNVNQVLLSKECKYNVRGKKTSTLRECNEWITPIGQNGGRSKMKRQPDPAVVKKRTNELKEFNDRLVAKKQKERQDTGCANAKGCMKYKKEIHASTLS